MEIKTILKDRFNASDKSLSEKRTKWTEYEGIFNVSLADNLSSTTKSQVFDPKLPTMTLDRESRVMAQLPTGKVRAMSKNDEGASRFMTMVLDKYILPNANSQFPFLIKNRMVDRYSNIYGNQFVLLDWVIKQNGYIGPDMWLIPIRDVFPQVGAVSLDDSDFIIIRTWKPLSFFENLPKAEGYKNQSLIYEKLKNKAGKKDSKRSEDQSQREDSEYGSSSASKNDGFYEVWSMYERDRWVDFCVDADLEFRDTDNAHDNGELPVANKYSIPLIDDFMALGDFERGKSMQYALNSLWNLSLDSAKYSIFPPVLINKDAIIASTAKWGPAAKWFYRGANTPPSNVASPLIHDPQGMNIFQQLYSVMNASLLNQFGTSDTSTTTGTDPGFGKTPEALKMSQMRENARDNTDRFYMEQFLVTVMNRFTNLVAKKMKSNLQIRLFPDEVKELASKYDEVAEMYDEKSGKLTLSSKRIGNILYDYEIVPGSTYKVDEQKQVENLSSFLQFYSRTPDVIDQKLFNEQEAKGIQMSELLTRVFASSGIQNWDKIIVDKSKEKGMVQDQQKLMTILQQIGSGAGVPPQPEGQPDVMSGQPSGQPAIVNEQTGPTQAGSIAP